MEKEKIPNNLDNNKYSSKYTSSKDNYISKIKNMFAKIIEKNNLNNEIKSLLINIPNFDSKIIFQEIDSNQKGYINSLDLVTYLKKYSNNYNEQIIRRFIQQYDKHSHFKLTYDDFNSIIIPNNIVENVGKNSDNDIDKNEIFNKILNNEFQLIIMINQMIIDIKKCDNFITYEAFISISNNEKNIDKNNMKEFLDDKYDINDINFLIYYLDMNNDGLISYDEFENFFVTLQINQNEDNNILNIEENEKEYNKKNIEIINNILNNNIEDELFKEKNNYKNIKYKDNKDNNNIQVINKSINIYNRVQNKNDINNNNNEIKYQYKKYNYEEQRNNYINDINYESNSLYTDNQKEFYQVENNEKDYYIYNNKEINDNNDNNLNEINNKNEFKDKDENISNENDIF